MIRARFLPQIICMLLAGAASFGEAAQYLEPTELRRLQESRGEFVVVDTRELLHYDRKHIEGALNIPAFVIATKPLPKDRPLVIYDRGIGSRQAKDAAEKLEKAGYDNVHIMTGGFIRWEAKGLPVIASMGLISDGLTEGVTPNELLLARQGGEEFVLVDIRSREDFAGGHIEGAISRPYTQKSYAAAGDIPKDAVIVLYDLKSTEVLEAAEAYRRSGYRGVRYLNGGILGWAIIGQPLDLK